jgi:lipoate-protein ligase A
MKWRLLPYTEYNAAMNMAIDNSILDHISQNKSIPTIRFYSWNPSAITLGIFQCRNDEVDMREAKLQSLDVVRRITGGGAVYHDREGEVTYSIIAPQSFFDTDIQKSYEQVCNYIIDALQSLNIKASFKPVNDIMVGHRKISGNAQTRRSGVFLQHGTIIYDVHVLKMFSVLKVSKEKVSDKYVKSVQKAVTSVLQENPAVTKKMLIDSLVNSFTKDKEYSTENLTKSELQLAEKYTNEKYSSEEWNNCRT